MNIAIFVQYTYITHRSWCSTCCEHISVTTSVLKDRFSKYDRGGTGDISFDDFLSLMQVSMVSYRNFSYLTSENIKVYRF